MITEIEVGRFAKPDRRRCTIQVLLILVTVLVMLAWYLIMAYYLKQIAVNSGAANPEWAWIPVLQVILVLRIAGWSPWAFFALLIPVAAVFVWVALWWTICGKLDKSRWLAAGMAIPCVNAGAIARIGGASIGRAIVIPIILVLGLSIPPGISASIEAESERESYAFAIDSPAPAPPNAQPSSGISLPQHTRIDLPQDVPGLIAALKNPDWEVREKAAMTLGEKKDRSAVVPLIAALKDSDHRVRQTSATALGEIGDPSAIDALAAAAAVSDKVGNYGTSALDENAVRALEKINDPRTVDALLGALNNMSTNVLAAVARALGNKRDLRAVEPLIDLFKKSQDFGGYGGSISYEAGEALKKLTKQNFGQDAAKWQSWWAQNKERLMSGK